MKQAIADVKEDVKDIKKHVKKSGFWQDFKKFISRGNIVDMAVGVVIGGSFGKIVTGLVNYIINPFVGIFVKTGDLDSIKTIITPAQDEVLDASGAVVQEAVKEVAILWGSWFQTILDFIITALCIFIVLRVLTKAKAKLEAAKIAEEEAKKAEDAAKAEADKQAAAEAEAAAAAKQEALNASIYQQSVLLGEIRDLLKERK